MWRVRFREDRWLYLVLLLEFQASVDRTMAVRMLAYTALLYQKLIADGALGEDGALSPVLPIVIYNGRRPWTVAMDVSELVSSGSPVLARYQPSQRYFLLDQGRVGSADLPRDNLVSALIALEKNRDRTRLPALLDDVRPESLPRLEEVRTMLEETVREWTAEWVAEGREQGLEQGREQGLEQGREQGLEQAVRRNARCCAVWRRGSSAAPPRVGWPRRWRMSATRSGWRMSATGSSSAGRKPNCSPVCMPAGPGTEEGAEERRGAGISATTSPGASVYSGGRRNAGRAPARQLAGPSSTAFTFRRACAAA